MPGEGGGGGEGEGAALILTYPTYQTYLHIASPQINRRLRFLLTGASIKAQIVKFSCQAALLDGSILQFGWQLRVTW